MTARSFVLMVPAGDVAEANATLEAMGHGPNNLSVPLRTNGAEFATHVGCHWWADEVTIADVKVALPGAAMSDRPLDELAAPAHFRGKCEERLLEWTRPADWHENPVMTGDRRTVNGAVWESLTDHNVWEPGVSGWREIVADGFAAWVQPSGAHDAYARGEKVTHRGRIWENTGSDANVWEPGVFGWSEIGAA